MVLDVHAAMPVQRPVLDVGVDDGLLVVFFTEVVVLVEDDVALVVVVVVGALVPLSAALTA